MEHRDRAFSRRREREEERLNDIKNKLVNDKHHQERAVINLEKLTKQGRKMPNWKAPGKDGVQGYWIKNLVSLHEQVAVQINKILIEDDCLTT